MDFCGFWLVRAKSLKFGGDDDAAELGGHVGGGRLGLRGLPGASGGGPGHRRGGGRRWRSSRRRAGLAGKHKWDRALDRTGGAVAACRVPNNCFRALDRDLAGFLLVSDEDDGDGHRADDGVPQAGERMPGDGLGLAVAGERDLQERRSGGGLRKAGRYRGQYCYAATLLPGHREPTRSSACATRAPPTTGPSGPSRPAPASTANTSSSAPSQARPGHQNKGSTRPSSSTPTPEPGTNRVLIAIA